MAKLIPLGGSFPLHMVVLKVAFSCASLYSNEAIVPGLESLLINVHALNEIVSIELSVDLLLASLRGVDASEVGGTPHLVGVELVGAAVLVAVASRRIVYAVEEGVTRLEAELAVEVVPMEIAHEEEAVVA